MCELRFQRNHFLEILRTVKPELLADEDKIPKAVTWAKVHVQKDTYVYFICLDILWCLVKFDI